MKKILALALIALAVVSCNQKPKDFVTFSGKVTNKKKDSLVINNPAFKYSKTIKLNEDGSFNDTLKVKSGYYRIFDGTSYGTLYLVNGAEIKMELDADKFDETINFSGKGANESNFLATSKMVDKSFFQGKNVVDLPQADINNYVAKFNERLAAAEFDSAFVANQKNNIARMQDYIKKAKEQKEYLATKLGKGAESPKFSDYENYKGGTTSLDDLKGKYVYLDIWATWCNPCKREIPFLKDVEKKFHNKNIEFVSISVDAQRDYNTWKNMVKDKELGGVQLYAKGDKSFMNAYRISGIPRFILLDPEGKIVNADAPRPSNPQLVDLLNSLDKI